MRFEPGFMNDLRRDLATIRPDIKQRIHRRGALSEEKFLSLALNTNSVVIEADHATVGDVVNYDSLNSWQPAIDAIRAGKVAFVVLAGGANLQTGDQKAFMRLPKLGIPIVANNLLQSGFVTHEGEIVQAPTWFMTTPELMDPMAKQLDGLSLTQEGVVFDQFQSYRMSVDNRLIFTQPGIPELHPTGHGDVGVALVESGVLDDNPKVEHVVIINCDNVLASLDPLILTHHLETNTQVTCEVVHSQSPANEGGGILVWSDNKLQVVETFRLAPEFVDWANYHNTNSMIISVKALRTELDWNWYHRRKEVGRRLVIQNERLLQQYTAAFETQYVLVERERRYAPIKVNEDLSRVDRILNGNR